MQVMNEDGHTSSIRDKILTITVKRGWKPGTRITFPEEGDQGPNNIPGKTLLIVILFYVGEFQVWDKCFTLIIDMPEMPGMI